MEKLRENLTYKTYRTDRADRTYNGEGKRWGILVGFLNKAAAVRGNSVKGEIIRAGCSWDRGRRW